MPGAEIPRQHNAIVVRDTDHLRLSNEMHRARAGERLGLCGWGEVVWFAQIIQDQRRNGTTLNPGNERVPSFTISALSSDNVGLLTSRLTMDSGLPVGRGC